ncbi:metallopeptidase family protein [Streptomyces sp. NPDC015346]|uniref:metallopeptidase family protein n=1 Tax=Streptomyces sp. NPDC015346 TaxID=3364954 RepID=UPI0036F4E306
MDSPVPPSHSSRPAEPHAAESHAAESHAAESHPAPPEPRTRRRDRHGRGMRGPVAPPQVPLSTSRADTFRDLVLDSVERLERHWPQLADVEFMVLDVPPSVPGEAVPLGGSAPAEKDGPARVVVYRRPVEIRSKSRDERALLVHEVVVEQVAELLGLSPESVDPRYGQD